MKRSILTIFLLLITNSTVCYAESLLLSAKDLNKAIDCLPVISQVDPVEGLALRLSQLKNQPNNPERQALVHALHLIDIIRSIKLIPEESTFTLQLVATKN